MPQYLHLSHWDAETSVVIPLSVGKDLSNYHIMGIRHLYNCYSKQQKGVVLNEDVDMNFPLQISAFISALYTLIDEASPVIIVTNVQTEDVWFNYVTKHTNSEINLINETSAYSESAKIILCAVENLKWLKCTTLPFSIVVIDDLDINLNRRFVKQLKGQFHIGLTHRNFLADPDQKLFRSMLLWAIPGAVGKLNDFISEDNEHLTNLRFPYSEWWFRLTWSFCESFRKPTREEKLKIANRPVNQRKQVRKSQQKKEIKEEREPDVAKKKRRTKSPSPPVKEETNSSLDTIVCDQDNYPLNIEDFPILSSIINDDVPSRQDGDSATTSEVLDPALLPHKEEDEVESRNRDILSLLYGD